MTHTILLLTANPQDTQLKLDQEVVAIKQYLPSEQFTIQSVLAVTPEQLRTALLTHQPEFVHFSGHGTGEQGIVLQNPQGESQLVATAALTNLFANFPTIQCVVLNACYSAVQASALVKHIPFVIGMNQPIGDRAAISFSTGFYQALGAGQSVETAFNLGRNAIELQNLDEQSKPVLKQRYTFEQQFIQLPFPPNPYFTGREKVLREVLEILNRHHAVAVSGMGGMGKTQTAMQFAYQHQHEYQAILWCQADTADNLTMSMAGLVGVLGLPPQQKQEDNLKSVMQWLATHEHWLLILDNADEVAILRAWLPQLKRGDVVVTTRARTTEPIVKSVMLEVMSATEAVDLLAMRTNQSLEGYDHKILLAREQAGKLAELLGYLPLALDQAAAYIVETESRFEDYIKLYQTHGMKLLQRRGMLASAADHPDPVAVTWLLSFEKVEKQSALAVQVLQQCAFLYADGILEEIFKKVDEFEFNEALAEIFKYSLLNRDRKRNLLAMHRLVQEVLRAQLSDEQQQAVAEQVLDLLTWACPDYEAFNDYLAWSKRSGEWLLNAQQGEQWIQRWQLQSEAVGLLFNQMGYYLDAIAEYDKALPLYEQALQIRKQVLGQQHPSYATSLNNLAGLYRAQGEYDKALPLYEQALQIRKQVLGQQHPSYATSLNNLAELYRVQGEYDKALPLYEQALQIRKQVLGQQHPDYASSLNNLAGLYDSQGEYAKALPLYEQVVKIFEQVLGQQHPSYATSLNNLAELYRVQGEYDKALPLYEQALQIDKQVYGDKHPEVATDLNNLAGLYQAQGEYKKALPLFEQALQIWGQVLGQQHPNYATSLNNLAGLYRAQGEYAKALPLYEQALHIRKQVLGQQHPDYATSLNNLAELYRVQGEYDKALPLYEQAVAILVKVLGEKHPNTQAGKENYEKCRAAALKSSEP